MRFVVTIFVLCLVVSVGLCQDDATVPEADVKGEPTGEVSPPEIDREKIPKMRLKKLRKLLEERGQECINCIEKEQMVEKVLEVIHMPVLSKEEQEEWKRKKGGEKVTTSSTSTPSSSSSSSSPPSPEDMTQDDVMKMFQEQQKRNQEAAQKLKEMGINIDPSRMNGGSGLTPEMMEAIMKMKKGNTQPPPPPPQQEEPSSNEKTEL